MRGGAGAGASARFNAVYFQRLGAFSSAQFSSDNEVA
jgi:hypothetical protein